MLDNIHIKKLKEISLQIFSLQKEKEKYIQTHTSEILEYLKEKQTIDYEWFVDNFDYIWKYRKEFVEKAPFNEIIVDFIQVYRTTGLQAGVAFNGSYNQIYLKDLITLWDEGYLYNGYPILSIKTIYHNGKNVIIDYIKDGNVFSCKDNSYDIDNFIPQLKNYSIKCDNLNIWDGYKTIDILKKRSS